MSAAGLAAERAAGLTAGLAAERPGVQVAGAGRIPEKTAEHGQGEVLADGGEPFVARQRSHQEIELLPQVAVAAAFDLSRQLPQPSRAVVRGEAVAGPAAGLGVVGRMQEGGVVERPVLGDEQED